MIFQKKGYFSLSDIYRMKKKHIDAHEIMEVFQKYPAIPDTFDGQLPSVVYDKEDSPPVIGERYTFDNGQKGDLTAEITTAVVSEQEKTMWIGLDNGHIVKKSMSDRLLQDYQKHPDTFFGIIHETGKSFKVDDRYDLFEQMVKIHLNYSRENILKRLQSWPNQDGLRALSHEDLTCPL